MSYVASKDISRDALEELENLIEQLKHTRKDLALKTPDARVRDSNELLSRTKNDCGNRCGKAFQDCFALSNTEDEKRKCKTLFEVCFPKCYFETYQGNNEGICREICLKNYDQCVFGAHITFKDVTDIKCADIKFQQFICLDYRQSCFGNCPGHKNSKRSCLGECEGKLHICNQLIQNLRDKYECLLEEKECRTKCEER